MMIFGVSPISCNNNFVFSLAMGRLGMDVKLVQMVLHFLSGFLTLRK